MSLASQNLCYSSPSYLLCTPSPPASPHQFYLFLQALHHSPPPLPPIRPSQHLSHMPRTPAWSPLDILESWTASLDILESTFHIATEFNFGYGQPQGLCTCRFFNLLSNPSPACFYLVNSSSFRLSSSVTSSQKLSQIFLIKSNPPTQLLCGHTVTDCNCLFVSVIA